MPWDGEEDAAVARVRDQDGAVARQEAGVEDQMDALAGNNHCLRGRFGFLTESIRESSSGIDHHLRRRAKLLARFAIASRDTVHKALVVLRQARDFRVVEKGSSLLMRSNGHVDEQTGVIELAIVVDRASSQAFGFQGREMLEGFLLGEDTRCSKTVFTRKKLIQLQAQSVKRRFPPIIVGYDEGQVMH